jgi:hypothetical protein
VRRPMSIFSTTRRCLLPCALPPSHCGLGHESGGSGGDGIHFFFGYSALSTHHWALVLFEHNEHALTGYLT